MRRRCGRLGVRVPGSNAEVARRSDLLIVSLPSSPSLRDVVAELEGAPPPRRGQIVVETSTLPPAEKLAAAAAMTCSISALAMMSFSGCRASPQAI